MRLSNTLITVMCHAEAQATVDRHMPMWEAHGCEILFACPTDSMVTVKHPVLAMGKASHHSPGANRRFKDLLKFLAQLNFSQFVLLEYDALCLSKGIPHFYMTDETGMRHYGLVHIAGNVFHDDRPNRGFVGKTFIHPPLVMTKEGLHLINLALDRLPDEVESGYWDRMLGLAIEESVAKINLIDLQAAGLGVSRNTVEDADIPAVCEDVKRGACFVHGVKTAECLRKLLEAHSQAVMRCGLEVPL